MATDGLRVLFAPYFPENPYLRELQRELKVLGVNIANATLDADELSLRRRYRFAAPHVLHLHWAEKYIVDKSLARALSKTFRFGRDLRYFKEDGAKIVWTVHNALNHERRHVRLEASARRRLVSAVDAFIVHGDAGRDLVYGEFGAPRDALVKVIPHGTYVGCYPDSMSREEARGKLGLPSDAVVFASVGRLQEYKGLDDLLAAFATAAEPLGARLVIAGESADDGLVDSLERSVRGRDAVRLDVGFVPDDKLQLYLNAADVVVLPYRRILASGAAVLAMSFSKAVIAPRLGELGECVGEEGGFLYDPASRTGLSDALRRAYDARDRLRAIGERNRARAEEWSWAGVARETLDVYAELAPKAVYGDEKRQRKLDEVKRQFSAGTEDRDA